MAKFEKQGGIEMNSPTAATQVTISWASALTAIQKLVEMGKAEDFCERDARVLEVAARTIREMLRERVSLEAGLGRHILGNL